ncbi:right-handed parallel beta-helix repeat-containing protein [Edaphovirga cremea]|uniref:right-handed parallel beta-helix repeat-containing protein n=1 Tax=Edaphovirga cremea TaxID=2267246 RepID=UPI00398A3FB4
MNRRMFLRIASISALAYISSLSVKAKGKIGSLNGSDKDIPSTGDNGLIKREINILDLGAHSCTEGGYSKFDNRNIIQKAIDLCNDKYQNDEHRWTVVIPEGCFLVSAVLFNEPGSVKPFGICSLVLKSNVIITGQGTIKLLDAQYGNGAFMRIFTSYRTQMLENVDILNIVVDGNSSNQVHGRQASNILLECKENIFIENVKSINSNGNGIQVRGGSEHSTAARNIIIKNCTVRNCTRIGIQVAQFTGLFIEGNDVSFCVDNGIDIYGDMGKGTSPRVNGNDFNINNNKVSSCLNGVFPETVANGRVYDNDISGMKESGVHINRIHGLPANILVENNKVSNSKFGITVTGNMKNIIFQKNQFSEISTSFISLGSGRGNSTDVTFDNNTLVLADTHDVKLVSLNGNVIRNIKISNNSIKIGSGIKNKIELNNMISNKATSINDTVILDGWVVH